MIVSMDSAISTSVINDLKSLLVSPNAFRSMLVLVLSMIAAYWLSKFLARGLIFIAQRIGRDITADLEYVLLSMKTEEASAKNLFGSTTHHFNGSLWLAFVKNSTLEYTVGIQTQNRLRKGKENIYEAYRPDENYPSIYDYRLVGTRSRYTSIVSQNMLQGKINYNLTDNFTLEALLGVEFRAD